ncbi:uncharacterized protein LOC119021623 isoform X5 [Acanthopagrus latus]|uniref:uncharacterized protein LOC119021623 isoform X5 n=1 Tax=Acanthopagrus latus TaxID=8177 RepID=UPI00187CFBF8|nr:uncharacterized protein LOC119021623 isoform X5 [Acanthopagrus latus]
MELTVERIPLLVASPAPCPTLLHLLLCGSLRWLPALQSYYSSISGPLTVQPSKVRMAYGPSSTLHTTSSGSSALGTLVPISSSIPASIWD